VTYAYFDKTGAQENIKARNISVVLLKDSQKMMLPLRYGKIQCGNKVQQTVSRSRQIISPRNGGGGEAVCLLCRKENNSYPAVKDLFV